MQQSINQLKNEHLLRVSELRKQILAAHQEAKKALVTLKIARKETVTDGKLTMIFNYMPALMKKNEGKVQNQIPFNPFLNPDKDLFIKQLGTTHRLLFNKFNIFQNHLLVVTRQFQKQTDKITHQDMFYGALVREALDGILFFNGGNLSGASQPHKHLQVLPHQAKDLPIVSALQQFISSLQKGTTPIIRFPHFNFIHGIIPIYPNELQQTGDALFRGYESLYEQLITKNKQKGGIVSDYNMIATDSFILMALRGQQLAFNKLSVNSVGFMGSLLFKDEKLLSQFTQIHPSSILESVCIKDIKYN